MRYVLPAIVMLAYGLAGATNDIFPTDYVANRPGDTLATLYLKNSSSSGYYKDKTKLLNDSLSMQIMALRVGHTIDILGLTTSLVGVGIYAKSIFDGSVVESLYPKSTSGAGDLRLGATGWLVNDSKNMEYLALSSFVSLPTGSYDAARSINIGENRHKGIFTVGYVKRVLRGNNGELFLELSPECTIYGKNSDAKGKTITQKPSFALTGYLRYRPVPWVGMFAGYQTNQGGESYIDGAAQNDTQNNQRVMLGGSLFAYNTQIILRYAKDTVINTGFKTGSETTLRLQWNFR